MRDIARVKWTALRSIYLKSFLYAKRKANYRGLNHQYRGIDDIIAVTTTIFGTYLTIHSIVLSLGDGNLTVES